MPVGAIHSRVEQRPSPEPRLGPPLFKGRVKERCRGLALELPLPRHPHVFLMIDARPPHGPIALTERTRHEEIPLGPSRVALHVNLAIEAVVDRKGKELRGATGGRKQETRSAHYRIIVAMTRRAVTT